MELDKLQETAESLLGAHNSLSIDTAWLMDRGFTPVLFDVGGSHGINIQLDVEYSSVTLYGYERRFELDGMRFNVIAVSSREEDFSVSWSGLLPLELSFNARLMSIDDSRLDGTVKRYGGKLVEFGKSRLAEFKSSSVEDAVLSALSCGVEIVQSLKSGALR